MSLIFDIETDGFIKKLTKIHCIVIQDSETKEISKYVTNIEQAITRLENANEIIGHNIIGFDIPAIKKIYDFNPKGKITDTLVISREIWPKIGLDTTINVDIPEEMKNRHSLSAWGLRLKENKSEYKGGFEFYSDEMLKYCIQDVIVTTKLWEFLKGKK
tara:strand:+ start:181 stop:657 length:477 start_codon:yes stop_codon:yes gene_type:complete